MGAHEIEYKKIFELFMDAVKVIDAEETSFVVGIMAILAERASRPASEETMLQNLELSCTVISENVQPETARWYRESAYKILSYIRGTDVPESTELN